MSDAAIETSNYQELVTFQVGEDVFGVEVEQVVEVNRDLVWTPIPGSAHYVNGAANLRGHIVTVLDMRKILDYDERPEGLNKTVIIVYSRDELVGILVDRIADVVDADKNKIEPPPTNLPESQLRCISGVFKVEGGLIGILNLERALD